MGDEIRNNIIETMFFPPEQLVALRNMTLSKVICQNTKIDALQLNVFKFYDA